MVSVPILETNGTQGLTGYGRLVTGIAANVGHSVSAAQPTVFVSVYYSNLQSCLLLSAPPSRLHPLQKHRVHSGSGEECGEGTVQSWWPFLGHTMENISLAMCLRSFCIPLGRTGENCDSHAQGPPVCGTEREQVRTSSGDSFQ